MSIVFEIIESEEEIIIPQKGKKKAMTSEHASKVKKDGHSNEHDFSNMFPGSEVVPGTGKTDIKYNGHTYSLKKECKRIQFGLYSRNSKNWVTASQSAMLCKACLDIYPAKFKDYKQQKHHFKELLRPRMVELKNHLAIKENLQEYLNLIMFKNGEVDFLVLKDKEEQHIFDSTKTINTLINNVEVCNSQAIKKGDYPEQKVIIKSRNNKGKLTNLIEIEIRNSSDNHYAQMLCVCNRDNLYHLLNTATTYP
jgi:hypothetical protein